MAQDLEQKVPPRRHLFCLHAIPLRGHPPSTEGPSDRAANSSPDARGESPTSGSDAGASPTVEGKQLRRGGSAGGTLRQASGSVEGDNISGGRVRWRDIKSGGGSGGGALWRRRGTNTPSTVTPQRTTSLRSGLRSNPSQGKRFASTCGVAGGRARTPTPRETHPVTPPVSHPPIPDIFTHRISRNRNTKGVTTRGTDTWRGDS